MAVFKKQARLILGLPNFHADSVVDNFDYNVDANPDVVHTYKLLKNTLVKSMGARGTTADVPKNAGYLRNTITTQQHSKIGRMNQELLKYSLQVPRKYYFLLTDRRLNRPGKYCRKQGKSPAERDCQRVDAGSESEGASGYCAEPASTYL